MGSLSAVITTFASMVLVAADPAGLISAEPTSEETSPSNAYPEMVSLNHEALSWPSSRKISRTEVTWAQYLRSVEDGSCAVPKDVTGRPYDPSILPRDDYPVVGVTTEDANCYVRWLGEKLGKRLRLPTSAEYDALYQIIGTTSFEEQREMLKRQNQPSFDPRTMWSFLEVSALPDDALGLKGLSDNVIELTSSVRDARGDDCRPYPSPCQIVIVRGRVFGSYLNSREPVKGTLFEGWADHPNTGIGFRVVGE